MNEELFKINLLALTFVGLILAAIGFLLVIFRSELAGFSRYLLPLPPLLVAAYVFVTNYFRDQGGQLPKSFQNVFQESVNATLMVAMAFFWIVLTLILLVSAAKRYLG